MVDHPGRALGRGGLVPNGFDAGVSQGQGRHGTHGSGADQHQTLDSSRSSQGVGIVAPLVELLHLSGVEQGGDPQGRERSQGGQGNEPVAGGAGLVDVEVVGLFPLRTTQVSNIAGEAKLGNFS